MKNIKKYLKNILIISTLFVTCCQLQAMELPTTTLASTSATEKQTASTQPRKVEISLNKSIQPYHPNQFTSAKAIYFALAEKNLDVFCATPPAQEKQQITLTNDPNSQVILNLSKKTACLRENLSQSSMDFLTGLRTLQPQGILGQLRFSWDGYKNLTTGLIDMLDECPCKKLCRLSHPEFRANFENRLIQQITETFTNKAQPITYSSLGSCMLFQDLVILTKLISKGYTHIAVNFIDPCYENLINKLNKTQGVHGLNFIHDGYSKEDKYCVVPKNTNLMNDIFVQFLRWFKYLQTYHTPGLQISFNIYKNQEDYVFDCQHGLNHISNILVEADLDIPQQELVLIDAHDNILIQNGIYGFLLANITPTSILKNYLPLAWQPQLNQYEDEDSYSYQPIQYRTLISTYIGKKITNLHAH